MDSACWSGRCSPARSGCPGPAARHCPALPIKMPSRRRYGGRTDRGTARNSEGQRGTGGTARPPADRGERTRTGVSSAPPAPARRGQSGRRQIFIQSDVLTSPKAFSGGHYPLPRGSMRFNSLRAICLPSLLFFRCRSHLYRNEGALRDRHRSPPLPLKLLEVHFQSRAVFLESMHINQNQ